MKLSEIKNEQALDTLADIIEPVVGILSDEKLKNDFKGMPKLKMAAYILKNHKNEIIEILARLDGTEPENYEFDILSLPVKIIELLNDPKLSDLFTLQAQKSE